MTADWFEDLMGFKELRYEETRANLEVVGSTLRSKVNNRSYTIGALETPSLAELRDRAASIVGSLAGTLRVSNVVGDVGRLHRDPANQHALFQVASQFNLLEMTGPEVTPERRCDEIRLRSDAGAGVRDRGWRRDDLSKLLRTR